MIYAIMNFFNIPLHKYNKSSVLKCFFLGMAILFMIPVFSQNDPLNSNYLIENGVSPGVLDVAANSTLLDAKLSQYVTLQVKEPGDSDFETRELEFIYDPEFKDGLDLRVVSEELTKKEKKYLTKYIEKSHSFSRLSRRNLYDESTLKVIQENGDEVILEFFYDKKDVDPYLKSIKRMKGNIYFKGGELIKVILKNYKPLKKGVENYEREVFFKRNETSGGHVPAKIVERFSQERKDGTYNYVLTSESHSIETFDGQELTWEGKESVKSPFAEEEVDTLDVKLGWFLPLLGKPATKLGYKLPRPVGVNIFSHYQSQTMQFTGVSIGMNDEDLVSFNDIFDLNQSTISATGGVTMAKADVWLFPFLNVMALAGTGTNRIQGNWPFDEDFKQGLADYGWLIGLDPENLPDGITLDDEIDSFVYGFGATLAGGVGDWNFNLAYQYMMNNTPEANTTTEAHVVTPLIGYMTSIGVNVMLGVQGQFYDTNVSGFIELDDGQILNYSVDFKPENWNAIFGLYKGFAKHWEIALQAGFGSRESVTAVFGYRF